MQMVDKASQGMRRINNRLGQMTRQQRAAETASKMFAAALGGALMLIAWRAMAAMNAFAEFQKKLGRWIDAQG